MSRPTGPAAQAPRYRSTTEVARDLKLPHHAVDFVASMAGIPRLRVETASLGRPARLFDAEGEGELAGAIGVIRHVKDIPESRREAVRELFRAYADGVRRLAGGAPDAPPPSL